MALQAAWHRARARWWLRACSELGEDPRLRSRPTIHVDRGRLVIGDRFCLASRPVPSHLNVGPDALLEIGHDVAIGAGAAIAAYERVLIGAGSRIGPYVIIMDTNFHDEAGEDQALHHDCRPVTIGAGCLIGSRVTIMRGVTIGDGAQVLAGSVVSSSVPAGACVGGARARIIGRAGTAAARWESAAARLPEILMQQLGLRSPPDLDGSDIPPETWTAGHRSRLVAAIQEQLGIALAPDVVRGIGSFAALAAALEGAAGQPPQ